MSTIPCKRCVSNGMAGAEIGYVEFVHIDDEKICGNIKPDDTYTTLEGNFIAEIVTE